MQSKIEFQNKSFEILTDGGNYINQARLFMGYFNAIPNIKVVRNIDYKAVQQFVEEEFNEQLLVKNYSENCSKKESKFNDLFYVLKDKMLFNMFRDGFYVLFTPEQEEVAESIIKKVIPLIKKRKRTKEISLVISNQHGLDTKEIKIKKPIVSIDLHYNDDFKVVHELVLKTLKIKKQKGLFLFHGLPGTGKSTYIKYLIHQQKKKVIFLSPKMAGSLDSANFTEFLIDNENSILIIEDAEELIVSRENNQNSHLSFLLNLTDGILADSLGIQIIATFNTNIQNIDKALLRKGRLTAIYEFKELEFQKVNTLFKHLKIENQEVLKSMSLADIFNFEADNFVENKEKVKIGF
jgi:ATP-dependent 26S proteasome regulatory subunit